MNSRDVTPRRPPGLPTQPQRIGESNSSDRIASEKHEFSTTGNGQRGIVAPEPDVSELELEGEFADDEPNELKHVLVIART
jgi:hypothetical protein